MLTRTADPRESSVRPARSLAATKLSAWADAWRLIRDANYFVHDVPAMLLREEPPAEDRILWLTKQPLNRDCPI